MKTEEWKRVCQAQRYVAFVSCIQNTNYVRFTNCFSHSQYSSEWTEMKKKSLLRLKFALTFSKVCVPMQSIAPNYLEPFFSLLNWIFEIQNCDLNGRLKCIIRNPFQYVFAWWKWKMVQLSHPPHIFIYAQQFDKNNRFVKISRSTKRTHIHKPDTRSKQKRIKMIMMMMMMKKKTWKFLMNTKNKSQ